MTPFGTAPTGARLQSATDLVEAAKDQAKTVFGQVMFLVAVTLGFAAAGAWLGRDIGRGAAFGCWAVGFALIIGLGFVRKQNGLSLTLLFALGLFLGLSVGPALNYYTSLQGGHTLVAQAAGGTALLVGGLGAAGWMTRRDLAGWAKGLMIATVVLFIGGIALIFIGGSTAHLAFSIIGLVLFSAWTIYDFNRLRRAHPDEVVFIAVGIFLDIFNIFWFLLNILGMSRD